MEEEEKFASSRQSAHDQTIQGQTIQGQTIQGQTIQDETAVAQSLPGQKAESHARDTYFEFELPGRPSHSPLPGEVIDEVRGIHSRLLIEVIESYIRYYAAGDGHTARAKRYDLQYFLEFHAASFRGKNVAAVLVSDWTLQSTKDYIDDRLSRGEAASTVSRRLATIKHFGRTLAERVPGFVNPAREVKSPSIATSRPQGLTEEEISLLRAAAEQSLRDSNGSFASKRNYVLLNTLLATGLRADEVRLLFRSQLDANYEWFKNVKTKGRKFRNVYISSELRPLLESYIQECDEELAKKFPAYTSLSGTMRGSMQKGLPVFLSFYRADIEKPKSLSVNPKTIWRIINGFGKMACALSPQPMPNLHPHKLRHTFAHGLLDSSKDVRLVAQALGHSDVRTTMRYTERTEEQLAAAIEASKD